MRTLAFLSRVAVLLNVMFLLFMAGNLGKLPAMNNYLEGFIVTTGFIAIILNAALHPFILLLIMLRKPLMIPRWIIGFNLFCFLLQIFFYFFT